MQQNISSNEQAEKNYEQSLQQLIDYNRLEVIVTTTRTAPQYQDYIRQQLIPTVNLLITQVKQLKENGENIVDLTQVLQFTYQRLTYNHRAHKIENHMTADAYKKFALTVQGKPSIGMERLGSLMFALGISLAVFGSFLLLTQPVGGVVTTGSAIALGLIARSIFSRNKPQGLSRNILDIDDKEFRLDVMEATFQLERRFSEVDEQDAYPQP